MVFSTSGESVVLLLRLNRWKKLGVKYYKSMFRKSSDLYKKVVSIILWMELIQFWRWRLWLWWWRRRLTIFILIFPMEGGDFKEMFDNSDDELFDDSDDDLDSEYWLGNCLFLKNWILKYMIFFFFNTICTYYFLFLNIRFENFLWLVYKPIPPNLESRKIPKTRRLYAEITVF